MLLPRKMGLKVECQLSAGLPCVVVQTAHCQKAPGQGGKLGLKSILKCFLKVGVLLSISYQSTSWTSTRASYRGTRGKGNGQSDSACTWAPRH